MSSTRATGTPLLARNALLNLGGQLLPLAVALVAIPVLVAALDRHRLGVLTLAWAAIGYFGMLDLGLGRALTQAVAVRVGERREGEIPAVVWTTLALMAALGVAGTLALALASPLLVHRVLDVPDAIAGDTTRSLRILALALPFVVTTAGLRGLLEAQQRFGLVNALRVPLALLTYVGPLAVLPFSRELAPIVWVLAGGRAVAWLAHLLACLHACPSLRGSFAIVPREIRPLLRLGGWMTVSNVVSPLMVYLDRFVIGAVLTVGAVAYYVTPYEVVTKLWIIPAALLGVLFPAFATSAAADRERAAQLLDRGARVLLLGMLPPIALVVAAAPEALALWIGADFAREGTRVLQWLAIGVFVNSVGQVPFTALQGVGRPDVTAKLHLAELPVYLAAMWWLARTQGIAGVALAWTLRVALDTALLFVFARRLLPGSRGVRPLATAMLLAVLALMGCMLVPTRAGRGVALVVVLALTALAGWRWLLDRDERAALGHLAQRQLP